jgi:hypothetical protein
MYMYINTMELVSIVSSNPSDEEHFVDESVINVISEHIELLNSIRGFTINLNENKIPSVFFKGEKYTNFISKITGNKLDLYMTLTPNDCESIHCILLQITSKNLFKQFEADTESLWTNNYRKFNYWIDNFTEDYIASPKEIRALTLLFQIIIDHNLFIHSSY